jgi:hypothetical protein
MNEDIRFRISKAALRRLYRDSNATGIAASQAFKRKARLLARTARTTDPKFSVSGASLNRAFSVALHSDLYASLVLIAKRLDVPAQYIGELVCCFDQTGELQ